MEDLGAEDPRWIGEYRLLRRLGAGGMGRVFLAHSSRGRTVAVKLVQTELAQQAEFRRRFKQEVRAAQRVGGAWTAPVLDADTEAATPWVATGYIAGPSLHAIVAESGRLPERTVRILAHGLTQALHDIHDAGLVHRDLKPSNVLVTIDGPRVIDFGIARALETVTDGLLTRSGAVVGSPGFMSPEQVRGERVTPASDVFCLGSVLAYAATGRQPFGTADSGVHAVMYRIAQEEPDLEGLPEGLRDLVVDCLKKVPDDRPSLEALLERTAGADDDGEPWLPGTLVAQLGRHAVQLLEVETPAGPGVPARPAVPPGAGAAGPAVPPVAGATGPAVPPPPAAPPSATSYPLAPAEPPTPPPPTTPPRPSAAPLPPAPATPPSAGAARGGPGGPGGDPAASQAGEDQGQPDPAAGPPAVGTPSADPRRAPEAGASGHGGAAAGSQGATPSAGTPQAEAAGGNASGGATPSGPAAAPHAGAGQAGPDHGTPHAGAPGHNAPGNHTPAGTAGGPATPNAPGGATPGHGAPHATPSGPAAAPHAGAGQAGPDHGTPHAGAPGHSAPGNATPAGAAGGPATPNAPGGATPGGPSAAPQAGAGQAGPGHGAPHATPGGAAPSHGAPHPAAPGHGAPGNVAPSQAGPGAVAPNSPGSGGPYAPGAYGYPSHATPPQGPQAGAEGEPQTPSHGFGPPAVTSFGAAGSPSAGFGGSGGPSGPSGPSGPGAPSGPGGGSPQTPPKPNRRRRKTLIVVSAAVATALIAGVAALVIVKGNDDEGDRAKTDYDKMTHTPPNPGGSGGSGGGNSKGSAGGSGGPDPSATKLETSGDVPTEYLGAWEGEIKESGESTGKIRRVVLSQGPVGSVVAETLTSDSDSFCQDSAKLKSVDSLLLIEDEDVATSIPEDSCSAVGEQTLRLGNDGTLAWNTTDGSSEATLRPSKSGGKPIPAGYVGTWLAKDAFGKPDATLKITIKQGAIGSVVAQEVADSKKYHCEGDRVLASVEKGLVVSPSKFTGGTPKNLCGPGTSLTFTSSGHDKLRVEYDDPDDFSDETMTQTFTRLD
ncbi:serine/threonine-protein kinase [Streptomyces asiaticus]|uniref:serine/threonine-protein kinase n=1 Tax=Streptomyces asiaticus TaxID=114695 RepID=UPI003826EE2B